MMTSARSEKLSALIEKVKEDSMNKNTKISLSIIAVVLLLMWGMNQMKGDEANDTKSSETQTEQTSTSSSEETSSSQEIKNDGPDYTAESNTQFSNHLTTEINNQLSASGYQVSAQPVGNNVIYLYVPQDIKYSSKAEIQQIADNLYNIKESTFTTWAIDNGYDLSFANSPTLYVKSEDDTTLAEESGIVNKSMKVKVNN